jgi:hypothetical protein
MAESRLFAQGTTALRPAVHLQTQSGAPAILETVLLAIPT